MTRKRIPGNSGTTEAGHDSAAAPFGGEDGFTLAEVLISLIILAGAFVLITGTIPISALMHRAALEKEVAQTLAQRQMEYFLANPGPTAGTNGTQSSFVNAGQFPAGFTGSYNAYVFGATPGLTQIVIQVTPPHGPKVEISAIDTTYSNLVP